MSMEDASQISRLEERLSAIERERMDFGSLNQQRYSDAERLLRSQSAHGSERQSHLKATVSGYTDQMRQYNSEILNLSKEIESLKGEVC